MMLACGAIVSVFAFGLLLAFCVLAVLGLLAGVFWLAER